MMKTSPTNINKTTWFYDDEGGIDVIHEARTPEGDYIRTDHILIPWRLLREALARKDRRKVSRKQPAEAGR